MSSNVEVQNKKHNILSIISGTLIAIAITLILILLFAVIIRYLNVSDKLIFPINQVIKVISLFIGVFIVLKRTKSKGFVNGIIVGLIYFVLSYIIFSILQGSFSIELNNLYDLLLTGLMSGLIGIILINFVRR